MMKVLGDKRMCREVFVFLRHPWDRLCSALSMWKRDDETLDETYVRYHNNLHILPYVKRLSGYPPPEFIGRYEHLDEDWQWVQDKLDVGPLPHLNSAEDRGIQKFDWRERDWSKYHDIYAPDFELCSEWQML